MKKKLLVRLFFFLSFLSFGLSASEEYLEFPEISENKVPSLQYLALKFIGRENRKYNSKLDRAFRSLIESLVSTTPGLAGVRFSAIEKDITREVSEIAQRELEKEFEGRKLPFELFTFENYALNFLLYKRLATFSFSIQDLLNRGVTIKVKDNTVDLSHLSLTSLDGLERLSFANPQRLILSYNKLTLIKIGVISDFSSLRALILSRNELSSLEPEDFIVFSGLRYLSLSSNPLTVETWEYLKQLEIEELYLDEPVRPRLLEGAIQEIIENNENEDEDAAFIVPEVPRNRISRVRQWVRRLGQRLCGSYVEA